MKLDCEERVNIVLISHRIMDAPAARREARGVLADRELDVDQWPKLPSKFRIYNSLTPPVMVYITQT